MKLTKLLIANIMALTLFSGLVHAEAISSSSVMQTQSTQYNKQQIISMFDREEVQNKLVDLGVEKKDALARINAMTDSEINQLNAQLNEAPAGGIVGTIVTVLVVIAVLDVLGITDVYPFIRPINS
ncbi:MULTISPECIES: PA2779 family protein [Alteromonadaceae]|uniref:PA2779 family protein n=1 Tax=Alteromonadaceae TaxID=72275 RepID=UPI00310B79F0